MVPNLSVRSFDISDSIKKYWRSRMSPVSCPYWRCLTVAQVLIKSKKSGSAYFLRFLTKNCLTYIILCNRRKVREVSSMPFGVHSKRWEGAMSFNVELMYRGDHKSCGGIWVLRFKWCDSMALWKLCLFSGTACISCCSLPESGVLSQSEYGNTSLISSKRKDREVLVNRLGGGYTGPRYSYISLNL